MSTTSFNVLSFLSLALLWQAINAAATAGQKMISQRPGRPDQQTKAWLMWTDQLWAHEPMCFPNKTIQGPVLSEPALDTKWHMMTYVLWANYGLITLTTSSAHTKKGAGTTLKPSAHHERLEKSFKVEVVARAKQQQNVPVAQTFQVSSSKQNIAQRSQPPAHSIVWSNHI